MRISYLLFFAMFLSASICGCGSSKDSARKSLEQRQPTYLSPLARTLQSDLRKLDRDVSPKDSELIERYSLKRRGDSYWVSAFITLDCLRLVDYRVVKAIEISPKNIIH